MAEIGQVLARLKGVKRTGPDSFTAFCPAHMNTKTQALSVKDAGGGKFLFNCFSQECAFEDIARALGFEPQELMGNNGGQIVHIHETATLAKLSAHIGIPESFLSRLGWSDTRAGNAVAIPYKDAEGAHLYSKLRIKITGGPKFKMKPGTEQVAYGLQFLRRWRTAGKTRLYLVEGESDSATLWYHKLPALGIPGSGAVSGTLRPLYLKGFQEVVAVRENDPAGEKFVEKVAEMMNTYSVQAELRVLEIPASLNDTNDLYRDDPENFAREFERLAHEASAWRDTKQTQWLIPLSDIASSVEASPPSFLWNPYIPLHEPSMMVGSPGIGKSMCTMAIAAAMTRGWPLPGDPTDIVRSKLSTLFLAGEDDPNRVLVPRARKAGADLSKLFIANREDWPIDLWQDECIGQLIERVKASKVDLVIIDPLQAWVSHPKFNILDATGVRHVMRNVKKMCEAAKVTALIVAHDKKGEVVQAQDAVLGSRDLTAAIRSLMMLHRDGLEGDRGILTHAKHNYSAAGPSLRYRIDSADGRPSLVWDGIADVTAEDMIADRQLGQDLASREQAVQIIQLRLDDSDEMKSKDVLREGREEGISHSTMRRAMKSLGLHAKKMGGQWYWIKAPEGRQVTSQGTTRHHESNAF